MIAESVNDVHYGIVVITNKIYNILTLKKSGLCGSDYQYRHNFVKFEY